MHYSDSAVIFVACESDSPARPPLLQNLLFSPAALWLCRSLQLSGVERFFVVTEPDFLDDTAACFPETAHILPFQHPQINDALRAFVSVAQGKVLAFTQPVWLSFAAAQELTQVEFLVPAGVPTGIFRVEPETLVENGLNGAFQGEAYAPALDANPILLPLTSSVALSQAQYFARMDNLCRWLSLGVQALDMNTVYIDIDTEIGAGTLLLPGTILRGRTIIGENCEIGPNTMIRDCVLGNGCIANASQLNEARFGRDVNIGPFAYVRPGSVVADGCKVGDFVELKNSTLGEGTKLPHLIYVGDSDVGAHCNFGCGSITCNYDGNYKYRTTVGDNAFIGCNTNLVSPCQIGDGAYTAAGTTITDRVPADALSIGRTEPVTKPGWARRHRAKK